jgi:hypothetical protein
MVEIEVEDEDEDEDAEDLEASDSEDSEDSSKDDEIRPSDLGNAGLPRKPPKKVPFSGFLTSLKKEYDSQIPWGQLSLALPGIQGAKEIKSGPCANIKIPHRRAPLRRVHHARIPCTGDASCKFLRPFRVLSRATIPKI